MVNKNCTTIISPAWFCKALRMWNTISILSIPLHLWGLFSKMLLQRRIYIIKIYHSLWAHHHHTPLRRSDDVFSKKFWLSWNVQSENWCGEMHICENVIERLFACLTYIVFPATHYYMVETWICCYCTETTSMCLSGTPVWLAAPRLHIWRTSYHLLFAMPSKKPSSLIHANFCPNTIITPSLHCVTPIHA